MSRRTFPVIYHPGTSRRQKMSGRPCFDRLIIHYKCFSISKQKPILKPARTRINRKFQIKSTGNHVQSTSSSCLFQFPYTRDVPRVSYGLFKKRSLSHIIIPPILCYNSNLPIIVYICVEPFKQLMSI